jgi:hypothetical protein
MNATISRHIARALGAPSAATVRPRPRSRFESSASEPGRTTSLSDGALLFPPVVEDPTPGDDAIVHDTHDVVSAMRPARTPGPEGPPSRRHDRPRGASDGAIGTVAAHRSVQPGRGTTETTDHLASARRAAAPDEQIGASFRVPMPDEVAARRAPADDPAFSSDPPSPDARSADESTHDAPPAEALAPGEAPTSGTSPLLPSRDRLEPHPPGDSAPEHTAADGGSDGWFRRALVDGRRDAEQPPRIEVRDPTPSTPRPRTTSPRHPRRRSLDAWLRGSDDRP